ncbi:hypothetical protein F2P81_007522 [Scophthalmus maximus]|uniref:HAT C-terminal dimerisation domain-containing protein n=1 Tax=Scophthalmus maximus TaxID=52904 RepID=A0A6A4SZY8_SCOMX|nr:hypothetical protein F2P81_007522 [Scophthalmus maximus]
MVQRKYLTETVIPMMYTCVKDDIQTKMQRVGITCDTWTYLSTQSYLTVTSHYIDNEWCLMSHVLQTTEVFTSPTAINIADKLTGAIQEWGMTSKDPEVVTDNAANMEALSPSLEDSTGVRDLKAAVKNNLRTRYDTRKDTLYAASALDPRFKALPSLSAKERDDTFSRLQTEAATAARDQNTDGDDADEGADEMGEATSPKKPKKSSTLESLLGAVYSPTVKEHGQKNPAMRAEDEIRRYRAENPAGLNENPLTWWRSNEGEYPLLARLAKQYVCVPGTSIASERVFSTAGDIVTAQRSCLTPNHVDELLFLHKNLTISEK